jgi:hypothetical protein
MCLNVFGCGIVYGYNDVLIQLRVPIGILSSFSPPSPLSPLSYSSTKGNLVQKISVQMGPPNAMTAHLLEKHGAGTINPPTDLTVRRTDELALPWCVCVCVCVCVVTCENRVCTCVFASLVIVIGTLTTVVQFTASLTCHVPPPPSPSFSTLHVFLRRYPNLPRSARPATPPSTSTWRRRTTLGGSCVITRYVQWRGGQDRLKHG